MKLFNHELGLSLRIDEVLMNSLAEHGKLHYPKEFGGLLVGRYSENKKEVIIVDTILPKKFASSRSGFERETSDLRKTLEQLFQQDPSLNYVGEWHTHPDCLAVPSITDINAMKAIVKGSEVYIECPVLLIITITKTIVAPKFYFYHDGKLKNYEE